MTDPTTEFFEKLAERGHEPLLEKASGTLRFDLTGGNRTARWRIAVKNGDVKVSRANGKADCIARTDSALFEEIVTGRANAMAAILRGEIGIEGDPELIVLFQRLLPGPPKGPKRRRADARARKKS